MSGDRVQIWLERKLAREAREHLFLGVVLVLGAIGVLAVTFFIAYVMSFVVFSPLLHLRSNSYFWFAAAMVVLLLIANVFSDREQLTEYQVESNDGGPVVSFYLPGVGMVSNLNPFNPTNAGAGVKIIADIALTGPRLVSAAWQEFKRSGRLRRMNVTLLAHVLTLLLSAGKRVNLVEILPQLGHCDPSAIFRQLHEIEGVVFLNSPPPGLSLTSDLRAEFFETIKSAI